MLIKPYVARSTKFVSSKKEEVDGLRNQKDDVQVSVARPWLRQSSLTAWGSGSVEVDQLPLSKKQYLELAELLVFQIYLPGYGFARAQRAITEELPLGEKLRKKFKDRLLTHRNQVVAYVQVCNGESAQLKQAPEEENKQS